VDSTKPLCLLWFEAVKSSPDLKLERPERTEYVLGPLNNLLGYHLRRASAVLGGAFSSAVAGTGLRQVPFAILSVVAANPGIKQSSVGRALGIQRANMVALVNELVDSGLIERRPAEDDRRAFALVANAAGQDALHRFSQEILRQEAEVMADLSTAEQATLMSLLRRIEARETPAD